MSPTFSAEEFFGVLTAYNEAIWPMQAVLLTLAMTTVMLALKDTPTRGKAISALLASLWLWAAAYELIFFWRVSRFAPLYAITFVVQAGMLLWFGLKPYGLRFAPRADPFGFSGGLIVTCAVILHPMLALVAGQAFPAIPTFGLPCPIAIFTIGVLMWARPRVHGGLLLIPAVWSVVCLSTILAFGMTEDWLLPVAVGISGTLLLWHNRRHPPMTSGGQRIGRTSAEWVARR